MNVLKVTKIFSIVVASLVGLYALVGFFLVPYLITDFLPKKLQKESKISTSFKEAAFNPFTFELNLKEPTLLDDNQKPMFQTKEFQTKLNVSKVFSKVIDFENIDFIEPKIFATIEKDGKSNFASLQEGNSSKKEENATSKSEWNFLIKDFNIKDGFIAFADNSKEKPFALELKPINYQAKNISSLKGEKSPQSLITKSTSANKVSLDGDLVLNPLNAAGKIDIKGLKLDEIWDYGIGGGEFYPKGAIADISLRYKTDTLSSGLSAFIDDIKIEIKNIQILNNKNKFASIGNIKLDKLEVEANIGQKSNIVKLNNGDLQISKIDLYDSNKTSLSSTLDTINLNNFSFSYDLKSLLQGSIASFSAVGSDFNLKSDISPYSGKFDQFVLKNINVKALLDANKSLALSTAEIKLENSSVQSPKTTTTSLGNLDLNDFNISYSQNSKLHSTLGAFKITKADINLEENILPYSTNFDSLALKGVSLNALLDKNSSYTISLQDIELKNSTFLHVNLENPPLHVNDLALKDLELSDKSLKINSIDIADGKLLASLEKDGNLSLTQGFKSEDEATKPKEETSSNFNYSIGSVNVENFDVTFEDKTLKSPFTQELAISNLTLSNISNGQEKNMNFALKASAPNINALELSGSLAQNPLHVKGNYGLKNSNLKYFQNYIQEYSNLALIKGILSTKGDFNLTSDKKLDLSLNSDIELKDINIAKKDKSPLASWESLHVKNLNYQHEKESLKIKEALLTKPKTTFILQKDGSTNFENLTPSSDKKEEKATKKDSSFVFEVDKFDVQEGEVEIQNKTLIQEGVTDISKIKIIGEDFSTQNKKLLKTKASATINKSGYFALNSALNLDDLKKDTQFDIIIKGVPLTSLSPYTKNYLGYGMKEGTLTSTITQKISAGKLSGDNKIGLNSIELGDTIKSKDAISVPLDAAILLLKDSAGNVELDIPVSGDLNDPEFSYGSVIITAFTNLITGIVTAPFSILGNILGIDGKKLKTVDFEPTSFALVASEEEKMKQYAKILKEKPSLKLTITGAYDPNIDFKKSALEDRNVTDRNATDANITNINTTKTSTDQEPQKVDKAMLLDLANKRTQTIKTSLLQEGIDTKRIITQKPTSKTSKQGQWIQCEIGIEQ